MDLESDSRTEQDSSFQVENSSTLTPVDFLQFALRILLSILGKRDCAAYTKPNDCTNAIA